MKAISRLFWRIVPAFALLMLGLGLPPSSSAASSGVLSVDSPRKLTIQRGASGEATLDARLQRGYHVNSHQPEDEYIIPLKLTWEAGPLEVVKVAFPEPEMESYGFSKKPLSVFTGDFKIVTEFRAPAGAAAGEQTIAGKLRYQACTNSMCLPPKTVPITLQVAIQ